MRGRTIIAIILLFPRGIYSQGLFESAEGGSQVNQAQLFSGYGRGVMYLGEHTPDLASEIRSMYAEASLKLNTGNGKRGKLFVEGRFRSGYEYDEQFTQGELREAYADLYLGNFELRTGKQIIVWGRADGINPTNHITPRNYFVRSPEQDDMQMGNFLFRGRYTIADKIRLEGIWVPVYQYSVYRFDLFEVPDYIRFHESPMPAADLKNGSYAMKLDFLFNSIDGSLSWFNGYDPLPGIEAGELPIDLYSRAFRQQTFGIDFSTALGGIGLRGELAYRLPLGDYHHAYYAPLPDLKYVFGADRSMGKFNLMLQYIGQYVLDYSEIPVSADIPEIDPAMLEDPTVLAMLDASMEQQLAGFNRIIFSQTLEVSHSLAFRPSLKIFHETAEIEVYGLFNFSTEEWNILPRFTYSLSDEMKLSLGGQYFKGPEGTVYHMIAPVFNGVNIELRYSF